jgi:hypothetical protein
MEGRPNREERSVLPLHRTSAPVIFDVGGGISKIGWDVPH